MKLLTKIFRITVTKTYPKLYSHLIKVMSIMVRADDMANWQTDKQTEAGRQARRQADRQTGKQVGRQEIKDKEIKDKKLKR